MKTFMIIASLLLVSLTACSSVNKNGDPIKNFTFTDQNEKDFSLKDVKGKVWVADFIFTSCTTVCPQLTFNMSQLQKEIKKKGYDDVEFVSFSVDPEVDTPQALKDYASKFDGDLKNWHLLTGYSQEEIEKFSMDNFKAVVKKPENDDQVIHGTSFYLINKDGEKVKDYSGTADFPLNEIVKDINALR